jgi:hypothetical protein
MSNCLLSVRQFDQLIVSKTSGSILGMVFEGAFMKLKIITLSFLILSSGLSKAGELNIEFNGKGWDGVKVPSNEICRQYGGNGSTPPLKISKLPKGTNKIQTEYNAVDYAKLSNGGHGVFLFEHNGSHQATLKSIQGETNEMPKGVILVSANRWSGMGYLPPCSGGTGSRYSVTVKALKDSEILDQSTVIIGKY